MLMQHSLLKNRAASPSLKAHWTVNKPRSPSATNSQFQDEKIFFYENINELSQLLRIRSFHYEYDISSRKEFIVHCNDSWVDITTRKGRFAKQCACYRIKTPLQYLTQVLGLACKTCKIRSSDKSQQRQYLVRKRHASWNLIDAKFAASLPPNNNSDLQGLVSKVWACCQWPNIIFIGVRIMQYAR